MVMPPRNLWELLINVKVRRSRCPLSDGRRVPIFLTAVSLPQTDQVTNFICVPLPQRGTYLPQTYIIQEEMMVTGRVRNLRQLGPFIHRLCYGKETYRLRRRSQHRRECTSTRAIWDDKLRSQQLLWEACDECGVSVSSLYSRGKVFIRWFTGKSGVQFWCVGAKRVTVQKANTTRTKSRLPSEHFRQCVCSVKPSSNSLVARFQCVCVCGCSLGTSCCVSHSQCSGNIHTPWRRQWCTWVISLLPLPLIGAKVLEMMQQTSPSTYMDGICRDGYSWSTKKKAAFAPSLCALWKPPPSVMTMIC